MKSECLFINGYSGWGKKMNPDGSQLWKNKNIFDIIIYYIIIIYKHY